jgi:hypothetical protein
LACKDDSQSAGHTPDVPAFLAQPTLLNSRAAA